MHESIFSSAIRSFFIAIFTILGLLVGGVVVVIAVASMSTTAESGPQIYYNYSPSILPNASGIRKELPSTTPVILQVNINGLIGANNLTQKKVESLLIESRERSLKNNRVKAVLLHINSPGGTVTDADGIYRAIEAYKHQYQVPVYAFTDGICASGGLYIAAAADKIYASDITLVGSIGVLLPTLLNFSKVMETIGIQSLTLYDGKGKDDLNPLRPWVKGEEDNTKAAIEYYYGMFVDIVTHRRPELDKEKLINVYGASVYPAKIAKEYGYIDEHGYSLSDTIKLLAEKIGIHDDNYQLVELTSNSWVSELFDSRSTLFSGNITHQIELKGELPSELQNKFLYLYRQ